MAWVYAFIISLCFFFIHISSRFFFHPVYLAIDCFIFAPYPSALWWQLGKEWFLLLETQKLTGGQFTQYLWHLKTLQGCHLPSGGATPLCLLPPNWGNLRARKVVHVLPSLLTSLNIRFLAKVSEGWGRQWEQWMPTSFFCHLEPYVPVDSLWNKPVTSLISVFTFHPSGQDGSATVLLPLLSWSIIMFNILV